MRIPYWQFLLHIGLLSVTARCAIHAYVWFESDAPTSGVVAACLVAQSVFALIAAVAMWMRMRLQIASVVTLAAVVVVTSIVQMFALGQHTAPLFIGQSLLAVIVASAVVMALRYADAHPEGTDSR